MLDQYCLAISKFRTLAVVGLQSFRAVLNEHMGSGLNGLQAFFCRGRNSYNKVNKYSNDGVQVRIPSCDHVTGYESLLDSSPDLHSLKLSSSTYDRSQWDGILLLCV